MIDMTFQGRWYKFSLDRTVLTIKFFGDKHCKYAEGKIEFVMGIVEMANLSNLIRKKLRLKD